MTTAETAAPKSFNLKRFLADQLRNIAPVFTLVALVIFFSFASDVLPDARQYAEHRAASCRSPASSRWASPM